MKRYFLFLFAISSVCLSFAQLSGNGFYRIKNYSSNYYLWVCDNTGSIDYASTSADLGALQLWDGLDNAISEPASVLYLTEQGDGSHWDAESQGTGIYKFVQHYVQVRNTGSKDGVMLYQVFASEAGLTLYLADAGSWSVVHKFHLLGTNGTGAATRWIVEPINASTDNYFGLTPTITVGNKYYAPLYADFAFSFASSGMKAYSLSKIDGNIAVIAPIEQEVVPALTPVLIECSSPDKSNNRLNLLRGTYSAVSNNMLKGVFFCNEFRSSSKDAITAFNASTMRVWGANAEGKLVLNTSTDELHVNRKGDDGYRYLNANQSYLPVSAGTPSELVVMTEAEYAEYKANIKYTVTYVVDGKVYKTTELKAGETISPEQAPVKEGYTFSGWSGVPATMPANDITITGTFSINSYKLTYVVDGVAYKTTTVNFGTALTAEQAPVKEGYTFSGWSEVPATMPANDVTVTGTFSVNSYELTYVVDGVTYKTTTVNFGATLTAEQAPVKEGYTFSGWSEVPTTMPANDVTITGSFSINSYNVTFMYGDNMLKTISVQYGATIPLPTSLGSERYTLIEWLDVPASMPAHDVTINANFIDDIRRVAVDDLRNQYIQLNGVYTTTPSRGIHVIRMSDGTVKKVLVK